MDKGYGFKFLSPYGATEHNNKEFLYPLPAPDQKWGEWIEHPDPAEPDGRDCGLGRLHVMNKLSAQYAPANWWPWFVEWEGMIGSSDEKVGVRRLRLRRINKRTFWKIIRMGYCYGAYLRRADLRGADLSEADLSGADLRGADLSGASLRMADLSRANLSWANLSMADLRWADLSMADLSRADLSMANLSEADLSGADLSEADLSEADLSGALSKDEAIGLK